MESYQGSSTDTPTGRAAIAYARKGMPVFRLRPGTKEPLHGSRGFYDATVDEGTIGGWWAAMPDANVGIPTGERSGLLVLDVDPDAGGADSLEDLVKENGELPATTTVRTGRGGVHHYYRYPTGEKIRNSAGLLGPGLDVRGEGGYAVAPPSRTVGPYEVLERLPLADTPEWMLERLRRPKRPVSGDRGGHTPTPILAAGEKIAEGSRNAALTGIAGRLHDGTRDLGRLTADLIKVNEERCCPPLQEAEVGKIAASIHRRAPAKPTKTVEPEVLEALDRIEAWHLWGRTWKGTGWKTPRSTLAVLIWEARKHGRKVKDGIEISMGVRAIALDVGANKNTIVRKNGALDKLKDAGLIRLGTQGSGTRAGTFVLLDPQSVAKCDHSPTVALAPSSGRTLPHPPTAPRLRYSKPVYDSLDGLSYRVGTITRMGKSAEAVVDILEKAAGWMSVSELGNAMGIKHHRDLRRRALHRLTEALVVEWSGDKVRLRLDWLSALNRRREEDGEIADHERDRKKYAEQRKNYRDKLEARKLRRVGMEVGVIAHELNIGIEDVKHHLNIEFEPDEPPVAGDSFVEDLEPEAPAGFIGDLEPVFDDEEEEPMPVVDVADEDPVLSDLAVAIRDYLDRNPSAADEPAGWIGSTLWALDLYPGKPTPAESLAALEEIGGDLYRIRLRERRRRGRAA